ncbi:hypothetical protein Pan54_37610 [Rubinisphaera italica]|uniref:Uncharacterized protein n=2 Tax=Rubinisphaera italica TaxID=2527969 RepID=A0A5C5XJ12_9PLAN|nr:hypothetical protein Pan54_37610 [Rubinisphaera italica]
MENPADVNIEDNVHLQFNEKCNAVASQMPSHYASGFKINLQASNAPRAEILHASMKFLISMIALLQELTSLVTTMSICGFLLHRQDGQL